MNSFDIPTIHTNISNALSKVISASDETMQQACDTLIVSFRALGSYSDRKWNHDAIDKWESQIASIAKLPNSDEILE